MWSNRTAPAHFRVEEYDSTWPDKPPPIAKMAQYIICGRVQKVKRYGLRPGNALSYTINTRRFQIQAVDGAVLEDHNVAFWKRGPGSTHILGKTTIREQSRFHRARYVNTTRNLNANSLSKALDGRSGRYILARKDLTQRESPSDRNEELHIYAYPRDHVTFWRESLDHHDRTEWGRWRLCTNRQAAAVFHRLLNDEWMLVPSTTKEFPETPWSNISEEILEDDDEMAHVDEPLSEGKCRRIVVTADSDDTVIAAFHKGPSNGKSDAQSTWQPVRWERFQSKKITTTNRYQLWMDGKGSKQPGDMRLKFFNEGDKGDVIYNIIDRRSALYLGAGYRPKDSIDRAFEESKGTWKMTHVVYSVPHMPNKVTLWTLVDEEENIIDRVISKRFPYDKEDGRNQEMTILDEMKYHALFSRDESVPIVRLRGFSQRGENYYESPQECYMAFLEYCEAGDLWDLVKRYHRQKKVMPAAFCWLLFRNLVQACLHVESFGKIHPDIKPANIFLRQAPSTGDWRAYPVPVLGDFGFLHGHDEFASSGTPNFYAPEQIKRDVTTFGGDGQRPRNEKLHVFAIGLNLRCAVRGTTLDWAALDADDNWRPINDPFKDAQENKLQKLVARCVNIYVTERPSMQDLVTQIDDAIQNICMRYRDSTRSIKDMVEADLPAEQRLLLDTNPFAMGGHVFEAMAQNERKRRPR